MSRRRGFTLLELLVVIAIIGVLTGLLLTGAYAARGLLRRSKARNALQQMSPAVGNMKRDYHWDAPVGIYPGGKTVQGTSDFSDPGTASPPRNFATGAIAPGDKLEILSGRSAGEWLITGVAPTTLTVAGGPFPAGESGLAYYIAKADGGCFPKIDISKELDPQNPAWAATFAPHLNARKTGHCPCQSKDIRAGNFVDPWDQPYVYRLSRETEGPVGFVREWILCTGADRKPGTRDDLTIDISRARMGGG